MLNMLKNDLSIRIPLTDTLTKNDCYLFSRLYISCQTREGNLEQFYAHDKQPAPPSLSLGGKLRLGTGGGGVGVGYAGMCRWKGYGFQAISSGIGSSNHRKLV